VTALPRPPTDSSWARVQAELTEVPGEEGVRRRCEAYAGYFLRLGRGVAIEAGCRFARPDRIALHDGARIGAGSRLDGEGGIWIGRNALLAAECRIDGPGPGPTRVGDDCRVGSGSSLAAGARLEDGASVPPGSVVTADAPTTAGPRSHSDPAPSVALFARAGSAEERAARLLCVRLGLPQVAVATDSERLPSSVHTCVVLDDSGSGAAAHFSPGPVQHWRLLDPPSVVRHAERLELEGGPSGSRGLTVPALLRHTVVPTADPEADPLDAAAMLAAYYCLKRIGKRRAVPDLSEQVERRILALVAGSLPPGEPGDLWATLEGSAADRLWPDLVERVPPSPGPPLDPDAVARALLPLLGLAEWAPPIWMDRWAKARWRGEDRLLEQRPHRLLAAGLRYRGRRPAALRARLLEVAATAARPVAIASAGLTGWLLGDAAIASRAEETLVEGPLLDPLAGCIRSSPGGSGYCYSPLLAAFLLIRRHEREAAPRPTLDRRIDRPLSWHVFPDAPAPALRVGDGALISRAERAISRSLLDNWLLALAVPTMTAGQLELLKDDYVPAAEAIEEAWRLVFRRLMHDAGEPLVRVLPWPAPYTAALSLRYDVDRPTEPANTEAILDLQVRELGGPCATWYRFAGAEERYSLPDSLWAALQEEGVHTVRAEDVQPGRGAACHSAPGAEYWRGARTVAAAERGQAAHAEMLARQLTRPSPAWLEGEQRATRTWLLPLHFPLEGATDDADLSYFDRLVDRFRELVAQGGHAIVGSHPDLDQSSLRDLVKRERLDALWCVPVGEAVRRVRSLCAGESVWSVRGSEGRLALVARTRVPDVAVEIWPPGSPAPRRVVLQLAGGAPTTLPESEDAP